jgi:hypothetical protein
MAVPVRDWPVQLFVPDERIKYLLAIDLMIVMVDVSATCNATFSPNGPSVALRGNRCPNLLEHR